MEELEPLFDTGIEECNNAPLRQNEANDVSISLAPYLMMQQKEVARIIGIPVSTLSKRWRIASSGRSWPYRMVMLIDQKIASGYGNVEVLTRKREQLLQPVTISSKKSKKSGRFESKRQDL